MWWRWAGRAARVASREPTELMATVLPWKNAWWRKTVRGLRHNETDPGRLRLQRRHRRLWGNAAWTKVCKSTSTTLQANRFHGKTPPRTKNMVDRTGSGSRRKGHSQACGGCTVDTTTTTACRGGTRRVDLSERVNPCDFRENHALSFVTIIDVCGA